MNKLNTAKRAAILKALCEGVSVSATSRLTGASKVTILRLLEAIGPAALAYQNAAFRNLPTQRVQADEQWAFIYSKDRNTPPELRETGERGDCWTWVAIDADSKLVITWRVGRRDAENAVIFMDDLAARVKGRIQLTTDALGAYFRAVEQAFGIHGVDYARLVKVFGQSFESGPSRRYSPAQVVGTEVLPGMGDPDPKHISTSFVERVNLTTRMQNRRFTRLTNAFSRKLANHMHAIALHFFYYNFCKAHASLTKTAGGIHRTPAMAAGVTDHVWTLDEFVGLLGD
ncbi:MAG: IS1 family transposase [Gemmatimonadota bacterium]